MQIETSERAATETYLSRALLDRLSTSAAPEHWVLDGTTVFVDVSGFTKLSEQLARRGREGAEDITAVIEDCFGPLLAVAAEQGGQLLKFGGDALLLFFDSEDHARRAVAAAAEMRQVLRTVGRVDLPSAKVRLRMSVGVHSGPLHHFLVGESHRELVVAGPAASEVVRAEGAASAGQILLSEATVERLPDRWIGRFLEERALLAGSPPLRDPIVDVRSNVVEQALAMRGVPVGLRSLLSGEDVPAEHRMATVAFVHYAGTDALVLDQGPRRAAEALHELVTAVQQIVDPLEVAFLATDVAPDGGKIILSTGVPTNTGNDEERMLFALRQLAKARLPLPLRMGVHRGAVFAGPVGPRVRQTYTVMGDTVNLAARLMAKADPGQILASGAVLEASDSVFVLEELEPFTVKGKSRPVQAFSVGRRDGARSRQATLVELPLVGRRADLERLQQHLREAEEGRGSLVEVVGEAGIGKSRLVEELRNQATGAREIRMTCEAFAASTPYFAFRDVLRQATGIGFDDTGAVVERGLREFVGRLTPDLAPWLPLLSLPFDIEVASTPEVDALEADARRPKLFEVVGSFLDRVLTDPTIVEFDDAHWMDEASCALLDHLGRRIGSRPWLFVVMRQDGRGGFVGRVELDAVHRLEPAALHRADAMALAMLATRDTPLPPSRVEVIATRSSGNPQYLRDLLLAAAMGDDDSLPDSVEAAAVASIDRLAVADRALVRRAALFGSSFHPDHLEIVRSEGVSVPDEWTWARLSAFFEAEVDGYWRFRREVVRDAAYEGLPFRVRRELHSMIARWIEQEAGDDTLERAESLSLHFHRAGLPEPAWRYSLMSGDRSVDRYAPYDAARFYQRAIEVARSLHPDASELIEVFEKLGDAFDRSGQFARAHDAFDSARRHVGDEPMAQARLFERHSHVSERAGHFVSAVRWARRGLRAIEDEQGRDALAQRARLVASLATIRMRQRRLRDAEVLAREAIDVAEIADERRAFARACQTLEVALVESGRPTDGRYARRALEAFEELGDLFGQSAVLNNMGGVAYWEGRWAEAVELYERAADASTRAGMSVDSAFGDFNVGEILIDQGHVAEGEERVRRAEQVWRGTQDEHGVAFAEALLARAALRAGRLEEARDLYRVAIDGHRRLRAEGDAHVAEVELLELLVAGGQPETALEQADLIAASGSTDLVTFVVPQLERARGLALARLGELEAAVAALRASLDEAEARGSDFEVARTLDCLLIILPEDEQAAEWRARRDVIFERLGVVRSAIAAIATSFGDPRPAAAR